MRRERIVFGDGELRHGKLVQDDSEVEGRSYDADDAAAVEEEESRGVRSKVQSAQDPCAPPCWVVEASPQCTRRPRYQHQVPDAVANLDKKNP